MKYPKVSVIIPSYNHERYINQCVESIFNQTYKNFELIVIDDGSKDSSPQILKDLQLIYGFKLILQENHGISYTLNRGIKDFSCGEYITFCASDDYWTPSKLEFQVNFMEKNASFPMCYGKMYQVNASGDSIKPNIKIESKYKGGWIFEDIFLFKFHPPVTYLFRKEIFQKVGFYDENVSAEDFDMNLRISSLYPIGYINKYLGYYRVVNLKSKLSGFDRITKSHIISIEKFVNHPYYSKAKKNALLNLFYAHSGYKKYKFEAIRLMLQTIGSGNKIIFMKSFGRLIFWWS